MNNVHEEKEEAVVDDEEADDQEKKEDGPQLKYSYKEGMNYCSHFTIVLNSRFSCVFYLIM